MLFFVPLTPVGFSVWPVSASRACLQSWSALKLTIDAKERAAGTQMAPITLGDDCWIGGHSVIMPSVTIGARAVLGAGSVVTHDVPADTVAVGNPCRVIRTIV